MKHLIIILSILLLSSPVIGDNYKGEVLYKWETATGIQWREFGDKDIQAKYKGDVENGKPYGLGLIRFPNGAKYVGEWKDGKYHGQGTIISRNGEETVGEWYYGEPWNVKVYDKEGNIVAKFVNGKIELDQKKGAFLQSGVFYHGFRNGVYGYYIEKWDGVENTKNKDYGKYVGGIQDGKRHGIGTYTWSDGSKYVGGWVDGKMWNGTEYDKDGNITGKVVNNKFIKQ